MLFVRRNISYNFQSRKNIYDIVCIGPAAQKISSLIGKQNDKILLKKLYFKYLPFKHEANLSIFGQDKIILKSKNNSYFIPRLFKNKDSIQHLDNIDMKLKNQIKRIDPQNNVIELSNGQQVKYKYLLYSGHDNQWKNTDFLSGLKQSIQNPYSSTFADASCSKTQDIYSKINSNIYFSIPQSTHFGHDNYFMLHLLNSLRKSSFKYQYQNDNKIKLTILNEGSKIFKFNQQINQQISTLLTENGVEIRNNVKIESIDHRKRFFTLNSKQIVNYGGFYQYLPIKTPQILKQNNINPFDVNIHSLKNNKYPNVYCIGNILPTAFSFYSLNYMSHVIAKNITNAQLQNNKTAIYQGDTIIPFYESQNKLRYFSMNYQKTKYLNNLGKNSFMGKLLAMDRKYMAKTQIQSYYNGFSYGWPYYIMSPKLEYENEKPQKKQIAKNTN